MSHFVTGLVANSETLDAFASKHRLHVSVPLSQGLSLLPLRDSDLDSFLAPPLTDYAAGFTYLSRQLTDVLVIASCSTSLVYFETEYFGGTGAQGAAAFINGSLVFGPISAEIGPINEALALLGAVVISPAHDEFESVGLHRYRSCDDWLEAFK